MNNDISSISAEFLRISSVGFFVNGLPYLFTSVLPYHKPDRLGMDAIRWGSFSILIGRILVYTMAYILSDILKSMVNPKKVFMNIIIGSILLIVFLFLLAHNISALGNG